MIYANLPGAQLCRFNKGDYIIRQGDAVDYVYYIVEGTCEGVTITENGLETKYHVKGNDTILDSLVGILLVFVNRPSVNSFIAMEECFCYRIPRDIILHCVSQQPDLLLQLISLCMERYCDLNEMLLVKQQKNAVSAVAKYFQSMAEDKDGKWVIPKSYSGNAISKKLGIHPITTAKILKKLKEENIVSRTSAGWLIQNPEMLQLYAIGEKKLSYRHTEK